MNDSNEERRHLRAKRIIAVVSALVFIALLVFTHIFIAQPLIDQLFGSAPEVPKDASFIEKLTSTVDPDRLDLTYLSDMYKSQPVKTVLIYIGVQVLQVFIALIPGEVVEVAAGVIFGPWLGLLYSLLGVAVGSSLVFLLTKLLGLRFVRLFVDEEKINGMKIINSNKRLNSLTFLCYFIPGTPKDLLTYFIGLTRMKLPVFLLISLFARIPSVLTSTFAGDALRDKDYMTSIIIFAVTGVLAVAGYITYTVISKRKSAKADDGKKEVK